MSHPKGLLSYKADVGALILWHKEEDTQRPRWSRGAGSAHLPLLQQPAQGALPDNVASAQVQTDAQPHHHQAQEPSNNTGCDGRDLGAAAQKGRQKEKRILRCFILKKA